jgi:phage-related protein
VAADETWEVKLYETPEGRTPVLEFLLSLPAKHRAKVRQAIVGLSSSDRGSASDSSDVKNTPFRELRTRFAGQQYRFLYVQDGDAFVLFTSFHKTATATSHGQFGRQRSTWPTNRSERK